MGIASIEDFDVRQGHNALGRPRRIMTRRKGWEEDRADGPDGSLRM